MNGSVYDKIIEKGRLEALEITTQGEEKARNITEQILKEAEEQGALLIQEAKEKNQDIINTKLAEQKQIKKQKILANRKRIIHETFTEALNRLIAITDKELIAYVINSLSKASLKGDEVISVNSKDKERYQRLFSSKKNNELDLLSQYLNKDIHLTMANKVENIAGGYIINGKYFDIDNSYEAVLGENEKVLETNVALKLFGNEE